MHLLEKIELNYRHELEIEKKKFVSKVREARFRDRF